MRETLDDFLLDFCCLEAKFAIIVSDEKFLSNEYYFDVLVNYMDRFVNVIRSMLALEGEKKTSPEGTSGEAGGGNEKGETNTNGEEFT